MNIYIYFVFVDTKKNITQQKKSVYLCVVVCLIWCGVVGGIVGFDLVLVWAYLLFSHI